MAIDNIGKKSLNIEFLKIYGVRFFKNLIVIVVVVLWRLYFKNVSFVFFGYKKLKKEKRVIIMFLLVFLSLLDKCFNRKL